MALVDRRLPESSIPAHLELPSELRYPQSQYSLLSAARELYGLDRFRDASNILKDLCKNYPENRPAKQELTRTISRLLEQQRGFYNFRVLYSEAANSRPPCLDHATYVGAVEVRESEGKGLGLFATKDVKAGDFLVCEKAFAYTYADNPSDLNLGNKSALIYNIIQKLSRNTNLIPSFSEIYHGDHVPALGPDGAMVVDPVLVERVVTLNAFGGSLSSLAAHLADVESAAGHSIGIWALAARLNHSCFSNCRRSFIGDMQIIRAAQDMPAGTELSFPYRIPDALDHDYKKIQQELKKYDFICACPLCLDAKTTSEATMTKRAKLREQLTMAFATGSSKGSFDCAKVNTARIVQVLASLETTYKEPAPLVPRTGMWDPYLALTRMYAVLAQEEQVIRTSLKTMEMLGFVITGANVYLRDDQERVIVVDKWGLVVDYLPECWLIIWTAYALLGDKERADMARTLASVSYRIVVGEDETFEETYGAKARGFIAKGKLWTSV